LREDRYIGDPVIAVFDNLLPDNDAMRKNLAERVKAKGNDAYSLLAAIGRDCVGALQFLPDGIAPGPAGTISGRPASDAKIGQMVQNLSSAPLGVDEDAEFRISLAGTQEKTALLNWKNKWHIPTGTTATTHILKPQIGMLANGIDMSQSVENEHFCMRLMAELGLPTAKTHIQDFDGTRVLVVERFDRIWTRDKRLIRRPQEDLCQALSVPPARKYQFDGGPGMSHVLDILKGSDNPDADQKLFLKAQIIFWLIGATDGHAKNFSLYLAPGGRFSMAPLYDVLSAQPNMDAGQIRRNQMKLALSVGDNRHYIMEQIMPRHFYQTAKRCGIAESMITGILTELLEAMPEALGKTSAAMPAGFPKKMAASIKAATVARLESVDRAVNQETP
jgi:serine/threonine-protein kinase HipA